MLVYHPAYDVNHGMFRMLRLLEANPQHELKWDTFRILDFYYLFPHLLVHAELPRNMTGKKRRYAKLASAYTHVPSPRMFIQQMQGIHESVARSVAAKGFIEPSDLEVQLLARTDMPLPPALLDGFRAAISDQDLIEMLAVELAAIPLSGDKGLKRRTGLLEHRYDAA